MDTTGFTEKGVLRKAAVQGIFTKLYYLTEVRGEGQGGRRRGFGRRGEEQGGWEETVTSCSGLVSRRLLLCALRSITGRRVGEQPA